MIRPDTLTVIGGGLAGCEAAWQAARHGCKVVLYEMKPERFSPAHRNADLAELVCSNSLRAEAVENGSGLLKAELRSMGSLILKAADATRIPAGSALAVDRHEFAAWVSAAVEDNPDIVVHRNEMCDVPASGVVIIATGPLTSEPLSVSIGKLIGKDFLYFHDALSPIVEADSLDTRKTFKASRYNKGTPDYINCPLTDEEYHRFVTHLLAADTAPLKHFEKLVPFEGCMPIEVMAERGPETLAHGPMKPVGLYDPRTGEQPYAVVQLRQENSSATLYNLVGFQTRLTRTAQKKIFSMIPGLEHARFARYGSMHRNTYIHAPRLLLKTLQLKKIPRIFFAGQITGVEGYIESAATGLMAGIHAARYMAGKNPVTPPQTTMCGGLLEYITTASSRTFQPMNANFGILRPLSGNVPKKNRKQLLAQKALDDITAWHAAAQT